MPKTEVVVLDREALVAARVRRGITRGDLVAKAGICRATFWKAERGKGVSLPTAKAIARVLRIPWRCFVKEGAEEQVAKKNGESPRVTVLADSAVPAGGLGSRE